MRKAILVLITATGLGACSGDDVPYTAPEQRSAIVHQDDDTCILWKGVTTAGATVEAYAQPDQEAMKTIPDGGEFDMPHISRTTADSHGKYELTIPKADLSTLVEENPSFNMMLVGQTDERYGVTSVFRESQCDTALKDEPLKLEGRRPGQ